MNKLIIGGIGWMKSLYFLPGILMFFIWIAMVGLCIYSFILFIKVARRGIIALDIYINEKESGKPQ